MREANIWCLSEIIGLKSPTVWSSHEPHFYILLTELADSAGFGAVAVTKVNFG